MHPWLKTETPSLQQPSAKTLEVSEVEQWHAIYTLDMSIAMGRISRFIVDKCVRKMKGRKR